jgi:PAP2 superfamily
MYKKMKTKMNISKTVRTTSMIMLKTLNQSKVIFIALACLLLWSNISFCQQSDSSKTVPISKIFYKLPHNIGGAVTYNYGLNMLAAGVGSYALIHTNADWKIREFTNSNSAFAIAGEPSVIVGGLAPIIAPVGMYLIGRKRKNTKLQIAGLALGQATLISFGVTSTIKAITGRKDPNSVGTENFSADFNWGFFRRGVFHGWPSGHTTTAFAMAVTLNELYPENTTLKICSLTYATLIGLGVSTDIHWFSDAFAGAFIGYAIGKSVGKSFNYLLKGNKKYISKLTLYPTGNGFGLIYKI